MKSVPTKNHLDLAFNLSQADETLGNQFTYLASLKANSAAYLAEFSEVLGFWESLVEQSYVPATNRLNQLLDAYRFITPYLLQQDQQIFADQKRYKERYAIYRDHVLSYASLSENDPVIDIEQLFNLPNNAVWLSIAPGVRIKFYHSESKSHRVCVVQPQHLRGGFSVNQALKEKTNGFSPNDSVDPGGEEATIESLEPFRALYALHCSAAPQSVQLPGYYVRGLTVLTHLGVEDSLETLLSLLENAATQYLQQPEPQYTLAYPLYFIVLRYTRCEPEQVASPIKRLHRLGDAFLKEGKQLNMAALCYQYAGVLAEQMGADAQDTALKNIALRRLHAPLLFFEADRFYRKMCSDGDVLKHRLNTDKDTQASLALIANLLRVGDLFWLRTHKEKALQCYAWVADRQLLAADNLTGSLKQKRFELINEASYKRSSLKHESPDEASLERALFNPRFMTEVNVTQASERSQLQALRERLRDAIAHDPIEAQAAYLQGMYQFLNGLIHRVEVLSGEQPPCRYAVIGLGSLGRDELCPASDIEFALIVEDDSLAVSRYFQRWVQLLELLVIRLGETAQPATGDVEKFDMAFVSIAEGFRFDEMGNVPFSKKGKTFVGTPSQLLSAFKDGDVVGDRVVRHALSTTAFIGPVEGEALYDDFKEQLRTYLSTNALLTDTLAYYLIEDNLPSFSLSTLDEITQVNIKKQLLRPLTFFMQSIALHYGLAANSTQARIRLWAEKKQLPAKIGEALNTAFTFFLTLRSKAHLHYGYEAETLYLITPAPETQEATGQPPFDLKMADTNQSVADNPLLLTLQQHFDQSIKPLNRAIQRFFDVSIEPAISFSGAFADPSFSATVKDTFEKLCDFVIAHYYLANDTSENAYEYAIALEKKYPKDLRFRLHRIVLTTDNQLAMKSYLSLCHELPLAKRQRIILKLLDCYETSPQRQQQLNKTLAHVPIDKDGSRWLSAQEKSTWRKALLEITEPADYDSPIRFHSCLLDQRTFKPSIIQQIFLQAVQQDGTTRYQFQRHEAFGTRAVARIAHETANSTPIRIHLKKDPEMPGMEYLVNSLARLFVGGIMPEIEWAQIALRGEPPYNVLFSQTVLDAEPLGVMLRCNAVNPLRIDAENFSRVVLAFILMNPEDGKEDNYLLQTVEDCQGQVYQQLISVDNDRYFVPPFVLTGYLSQTLTLLVKNIVYCFDQMNEAVHPDVIKEILAIDPFALLSKWIQTLKQREAECHFLIANKTNSMENTLQLPQGLISNLHLRFVRIQEQLACQPKITHLSLLKVIEPLLGYHYEKELKEVEKSPLARFENLTHQLYDRNRQSIVRTGTFYLSLVQQLPTWDQWKQQRYQPIEAAGLELMQLDKTLRTFQKKITASIESLQRVSQSFSALSNVLKATILMGNQSQLIDSFQLASSLETAEQYRYSPIDFSKLSDSHQHALLQLMLGKWFDGRGWKSHTSIAYRQLLLKDSSALNNELLIKLLENSPELLVLDISRCFKLTSDGYFNNLPQKIAACQCLEKLYMNSLYFKYFDAGKLIALPALRRLEIKYCENLEWIRFTLPDAVLLSIDVSGSPLMRNKRGIKEFFDSLRNQSQLQNVEYDDCGKKLVFLGSETSDKKALVDQLIKRTDRDYHEKTMLGLKCSFFRSEELSFNCWEFENNHFMSPFLYKAAQFFIICLDLSEMNTIDSALHYGNCIKENVGHQCLIIFLGTVNKTKEKVVTKELINQAINQFKVLGLKPITYFEWDTSLDLSREELLNLIGNCFDKSVHKVLFLGDIFVGKLKFLERMETGIFRHNYKVTIGLDFFTRTRNNVHIHCWNIGGQERFRAVTHVYYKEAEFVCACFDLSRPKSIEGTHAWILDAREKLGIDIPVLLIGMKQDIKSPEITDDFLRANIAKIEGNFLGYHECSAKLGTGIDEIFNAIYKYFLSEKYLKLKDRFQLESQTDNRKLKESRSVTDSESYGIFFTEYPVQLHNALKLTDSIERDNKVMLFLNAGANVDVKNLEGFSALHIALSQGLLPFALKMAERTFDANLIAGNGLNYMDLAFLQYQDSTSIEDKKDWKRVIQTLHEKGGKLTERLISQGITDITDFFAADIDEDSSFDLITATL